jgi:hypothetical protein
MRARLAQLAGTRMNGTLQVAERALNDLLAETSPQSSAPSIELLARNEVVVRYGVFHARAELPAVTDFGGSPTITVRLASVVIALAVKAATRRTPFVHVHGRYVTVNLAQVPALQPWRDAWRHVTQFELATEPRRLRVRFAVNIKEQVHA